MKRKVVVIGLGHLGAHVMEILAISGIANELVGIDYNKKKEWGEIRDLADMMPYLGKQTLIRSGSYEDLADADIAVMTACGKICDEDRLQELSGSIAVIDQILPEVQKNHFKGTMIVLTNPCDLIAWYISQKIDADVIGTGTALDSARLRARVAETLGLAPFRYPGILYRRTRRQPDHRLVPDEGRRPSRGTASHRRAEGADREGDHYRRM